MYTYIPQDERDKNEWLEDTFSSCDFQRILAEIDEDAEACHDLERGLRELILEPEFDHTRGVADSMMTVDLSRDEEMNASKLRDMVCPRVLKIGGL
jgi:hypothetical protein